MTFSGLLETGGTNTSVEIYTVGTGWSPEYAAGWTPPLYPRMHLIPDGRVFYSGSTRSSRFFNPSTGGWSSPIATTNYSCDAHVRHVRASAFDTREQLQATRDDFRRRQSGNGDDRNHRSLQPRRACGSTGRR